MEALSNGDLPRDVIEEEILLRLPVKTLMRFKCVCKHWYALIGSPSFVNKHFGHESNRERLLIGDCRPNQDRNAFALYVDDMFSGYEEPDYLQVRCRYGRLLGPLNGVFCVVNTSWDIALLNPAMRQFKPLPRYYENVGFLIGTVTYEVGFGLDPLSGDYKIVWIEYIVGEEIDDSDDPPLVAVYSSGTDSWRRLEHVDLLDPMRIASGYVCNKCLNGVYYWLMHKLDNDVAILAFDMSSENFREIQGPDCIKFDEWDLDLFLYGDSIALLSFNPRKPSTRIDVWVMKKEGCWTKTSTVGPFQDFRKPLGFWKNNELIFNTRDSLLTLCDVSTQKLRTGPKTSEWGYQVFSYKESLVSIKREGDNCKLWDTSSDFVKDFFK